MLWERLQVGILCVGLLQGERRGRRLMSGLMRMRSRGEEAEGRKKEVWESGKEALRRMV